jgi:hypothetical protein
VTEEKDVTALVIQLLSGNGTPRPIKGNQLSVVVKTYFPDFEPEKFHCRNLRDFIRKYAADDVMEISKAGMDIVYGLRSVGQQQALFESQLPPTQRNLPTCVRHSANCWRIRESGRRSPVPTPPFGYS